MGTAVFELGLRPRAPECRNGTLPYGWVCACTQLKRLTEMDLSTARSRKARAQEALRISELEMSLCRWQQRLQQMESRLAGCDEYEVSHARHALTMHAAA